MVFSFASPRGGGAVQLSSEGSRATCSGLKTHGEIPLGFSEAHKQCLKHLNHVAYYSARRHVYLEI